LFYSERFFVFVYLFKQTFENFDEKLWKSKTENTKSSLAAVYYCSPQYTNNVLCTIIQR
jgi:hypothetical protein